MDRARGARRVLEHRITAGSAPPWMEAAGRRQRFLVRCLSPAAAPTAAAEPKPTHARRGPSGAWSGGDPGGGDPELNDAVAFFRREGYLRCPTLIGGDLLERAQAAFRRSQPAARADWEQALRRESAADRGESGRALEGTWQVGVAVVPCGTVSRHITPCRSGCAGERPYPQDGRYFDTPHILETNDVWLEVLESPLLLALASRIIGDDLHLFQIQARTYPADQHVPGEGGAMEKATRAGQNGGKIHLSRHSSM